MVGNMKEAIATESLKCADKFLDRTTIFDCVAIGGVIGHLDYFADDWSKLFLNFLFEDYKTVVKLLLFVAAVFCDVND